MCEYVAVSKAQMCLHGMCEDEERSHMLLKRVGRGGGGGGYLPALTQHSSSMNENSCEPSMRKLCFCQSSMLCNHGEMTFRHWIYWRACLYLHFIEAQQQQELRHKPNPEAFNAGIKGLCVCAGNCPVLPSWPSSTVQTFDTSHIFRQNAACVFKCAIPWIH